jgi:hypothetical protein
MSTTKASGSWFLERKPINTENDLKRKRYSELKNFISSNAGILTVEDMMKYQTPLDRFNVIDILIRNSVEHDNCLVVLEALSKANYLSKSVKGEGIRYSLYNIAAFLKSCHSNIFRRIISAIHSFNQDIFKQNNKGENSLLAVISNDNPLSWDEKKFRYMRIATINSDQISKLIFACFNKIDLASNIDTISLDRLKFCVCLNRELVIQIISNILIKRKCSDSCIKYDIYINTYVKIILGTFEYIDIKKYKYMNVTDKSLELFFKLNQTNVFHFDELINSLYDKLYETTFNSIETIYDIYSFAITLGGFANCNVMLHEYRVFILRCLKDEEFLEGIDEEERIKIAFRTVIHGRKISQEIIKAFYDYPYKDGFINETINRLSNKKDSIYKIQIKVKNENHRVNYTSLNFFEGILNNDLDIVMDDTLYILEEHLHKHPNNKNDIIHRLIFCLLDSLQNPEDTKIPIICKKLLTQLTKTDIFRNIKFIEMNVIQTVDNPNSFEIWKVIKRCLSSL